MRVEGVAVGGWWWELGELRQNPRFGITLNMQFNWEFGIEMSFS